MSTYDFAKRAAQRINLELERVAAEQETQRVTALTEAAEGSVDFAKNCERRIAEALLEERLIEISRKEDALLDEQRSDP
jgi:hypothetical protein